MLDRLERPPLKWSPLVASSPARPGSTPWWSPGSRPPRRRVPRPHPWPGRRSARVLGRSGPSSGSPCGTTSGRWSACCCRPAPTSSKGGPAGYASSARLRCPVRVRCRCPPRRARPVRPEQPPHRGRGHPLWPDADRGSRAPPHRPPGRLPRASVTGASSRRAPGPTSSCSTWPPWAPASPSSGPISRPAAAASTARTPASTTSSSTASPCSRRATTQASLSGKVLRSGQDTYTVSIPRYHPTTGRGAR